MDRKSQEEIAALHASIQRGMLQMIVWMFVSVSIFGALVSLDRHFEKQDRENQEASVRW